MTTTAHPNAADPLGWLIESSVARSSDALTGFVALTSASRSGSLLNLPEPWNVAVEGTPELRRGEGRPELRPPHPAGDPPVDGAGGLPPTSEAPTTKGARGTVEGNQALNGVTVPAPALTSAGLAAAATTASGWRALEPLPGSSSSPVRRLWLYDPSGQGPTSTASLAALDTVVATHGWRGSGVTTAPSDPSGFGPNFTAMASALAIPGRVQVLFLDWGEEAIDPNPPGLAPYNAAGRVQAVATWAGLQLGSLAGSNKLLTLAGHSLGSYVSALTAVALGSAAKLRLVALDPAAAGLSGGYDLNRTNNTADPVPNLSATVTAGAALAFVVADVNLSIGLAGDNAVAGTAHRSFVVKGFSSSTSAATAHSAIPALYADLDRYLVPNSSVTEGILASFRVNRYSDSGGTSGTLRHEGVINVRSSNGGQIASIDGFTASGGAQKVSFVEAGLADPTGSGTSQDTLMSLRDVALSATASIETIVLGGRDNLSAKGNAIAQSLIGNEGSNRLEGAAALDVLTGGLGADTFAYSNLQDALIGGTSTAPIFESITDFELLNDRIDCPGTSSRTVAMLGSLGASLTVTAITGLLNSNIFLASGAACFSYGSRNFLAINDGVAGFNSAQDSVVELTGYSGNGLNLSNLILA